MGKKQKINNQKQNKKKNKAKNKAKGREKVKEKSENAEKEYLMEDQGGYFDNMREEIHSDNTINQIHLKDIHILALKVNEYFKLINPQLTDNNCFVLNGLVENNGMQHHKSLFVKGNSSIIVCPLSYTKKQYQQTISEIFSSAEQSLESEKQEVRTFLKDNQEHVIMFSKTKIQVQATVEPWKDLRVQDYADGQKTMIIGLKNTGKSYFCEWVLNKCLCRNQNLCIIDTDLGKNRSFSGTVSLTILKNGKEQKINIWVGELTPLNNLEGYLKALKYLYKIYRQRFFTFTLLVNTMGYMTGIGQILLYEIFNIIKPKRILSLNCNSIDFVCEKVEKNIKNGSYVGRLHITSLENSEENVFKTSTDIIHYKNINGQSKATTARFQPLLTNFSIKNIEDLLLLIYKRKFKRISKEITLMEQQKTGKISNFKGDSNMRIVILGHINQIGMLQVGGLGFGWQDRIYFDEEKIVDLSFEKISTGIISEGVDFDKIFYQINERSLIYLQQIFDSEIPYIAPQIKVLGNKGLRNNASKNIYKNQ